MPLQKAVVYQGYRNYVFDIFSPANLIQKGGLSSKHGGPIDTRLHVFAFNRLNKLFGLRFRGFVDYVKDCPFNISESRRKKFEKMNPSGWNCINALFIGTEGKDVGHLALGHYKPLLGEVWIYDSGKLRCVPDDCVDERIADQLWLYHGHANPNVVGGYSQQFCIQPNDWSCGYYSIFAAVCILAGEQPENYLIDLDATFQLTKELVEERFQNLKSLKIKEVLTRIATKKTILPLEQPTFYFLDSSRA